MKIGAVCVENLFRIVAIGCCRHEGMRRFLVAWCRPLPVGQLPLVAVYVSNMQSFRWFYVACKVNIPDFLYFCLPILYLRCAID